MIENKKQSRIFGLDFMRATAILMVLFGHCLWIFPVNNNVFHQLFELAGFLGVEIFFVLSGFLIGKILFQLYNKDNFNFSSVLFFLKRRWFRTLPNYFLILIINIGLTYIIGYSIDSAWKYFLFLQNFNHSMLPFFPESWSLSVEEFAYLILPIFLLLINYRNNQKNKSFIFFISVVLLIVFFISNKIWYNYVTTNTTLIQWNISLKAVVIYRLDSIYIGVLYSWFYINYYSFWKKIKNLSFFVGTLLFLFLFVGIGYFKLMIETYSWFWNVFYLPLVSMAVACFLPFLSEWKNEKTFIKKPIAFISLISYSIYLLHYSIILQIMKYYFPVRSQETSTLFLYTSFYIFITITLSYLLFRFYEKPMMDLRDSK